MSWRIGLRQKARAGLAAVPREIQQKVAELLASIEDKPFSRSLPRHKKLKGVDDTYRVRVKHEYRSIFVVSKLECGPDEQGIETWSRTFHAAIQESLKRGPDEEGIETGSTDGPPSRGNAAKRPTLTSKGRGLRLELLVSRDPLGNRNRPHRTRQVSPRLSVLSQRGGGRYQSPWGQACRGNRAGLWSSARSSAGPRRTGLPQPHAETGPIAPVVILGVLHG